MTNDGVNYPASGISATVFSSILVTGISENAFETPYWPTYSAIMIEVELTMIL